MVKDTSLDEAFPWLRSKSVNLRRNLLQNQWRKSWRHLDGMSYRTHSSLYSSLYSSNIVPSKFRTFIMEQNRNALQSELFNYSLDFYCVFWGKWNNSDRNPFRLYSTMGAFGKTLFALFSVTNCSLQIALINTIMTSLMIACYVTTARYQRYSFRGSVLVALAFTNPWTILV